MRGPVRTRCARRARVTRDGLFRYRQAKNGEWVKRWLELEGNILCSYKSSDKPKLLNAVNLKKARAQPPIATPRARERARDARVRARV